MDTEAPHAHRENSPRRPRRGLLHGVRREVLALCVEDVQEDGRAIRVVVKTSVTTKVAHIKAVEDGLGLEPVGVLLRREEALRHRRPFLFPSTSHATARRWRHKHYFTGSHWSRHGETRIVVSSKDYDTNKDPGFGVLVIY